MAHARAHPGTDMRWFWAPVRMAPVQVVKVLDITGSAPALRPCRCFSGRSADDVQVRKPSLGAEHAHLRDGLPACDRETSGPVEQADQGEWRRLPPRLYQALHHREPGGTLVRDSPDQEEVANLVGDRDEAGLQGKGRVGRVSVDGAGYPGVAADDHIGIPVTIPGHLEPDR